MSLTRSLLVAATWMLAVAPLELLAVDRTIDGRYNHVFDVERGAVASPFIRVTYTTEYASPSGAMISDAQRRNARQLSNTLSAQSTSAPSIRGLSDFTWAWGQFLDHDMSLTSSSNGAAVNGSAPIATLAGDPLGPNPIALTRSNFVNLDVREQINEVTSWIDGSQIYGSSASRAAAVRTGGGAGAKLLTSANNLLPYNTTGLTNQNNGPTPGSQLFLAGDIRANENLLLISMQTVFMREHNRLVDRIATLQPALNAEQQYQLARKIVGAELQAITYNEFLPALLGPSAPQADDYLYQTSQVGTTTNSFAHAAFRFGHSTLSSSLKLGTPNGGAAGSMSFGSAFFNPNQITSNPGLVDQVLMGAALQTSQEVDLQVVDAVRNVMFGPPGAGGTDLMAVDIQRGRDHGLLNFNEIREFYGLPRYTSFNQITSNAAVRQALTTAYNGNINNIDLMVGGLAEDHLPGSSIGSTFDSIIRGQFERSRDGDRMFYRGDAAGLYSGGALLPAIAAIIDLNSVTLADVIAANTSITGLPENVFFAVPAAGVRPGDFNFDGAVNGLDLAVWKSNFTAGSMSGGDFLTWQRQVGAGAGGAPSVAAVPEPAAWAFAAAIALVLLLRRPLRAFSAPGRH